MGSKETSSLVLLELQAVLKRAALSRSIEANNRGGATTGKDELPPD